MSLTIRPTHLGWLLAIVPDQILCPSCRGSGRHKGLIPTDHCYVCRGSGKAAAHVEFRDCSELVGQILASVGHVRSGSIGAGKVAA